MTDVPRSYNDGAFNLHILLLEYPNLNPLPVLKKPEDQVLEKGSNRSGMKGICHEMCTMGWVIIRWARPDILKVWIPQTTSTRRGEEEERLQKRRAGARPVQCGIRISSSTTFAVIDRVHHILAAAPFAPLAPLFVSDFRLGIQQSSKVFDNVACLLPVPLRQTADEAKKRQPFDDCPSLL